MPLDGGVGAAILGFVLLACGTFFRRVRHVSTSSEVLDLATGSAWVRKHAAEATALGVMVTVSVTKTLLTKLLFEHVGLPVAFSVLSCIATIMCILPIFLFQGRGSSGNSFSWLSRPMIPRFTAVCAAIAIDLACTNVALSLLSVALQQTIKATSPTATVVVESVVRRSFHHPIIYVTVLMLCLGPVIIIQGKTGATGNGPTGSHAIDGNVDNGPSFLGVAMMVIAVISGAFKYVFAHATIKRYRNELGVLAFTFWVEVFVGVMLLPWALLDGEMRALVSDADRSLGDWILLWAAAAYGGVRIYSQFAFLALTSATSLATSNLAIQALTIILGILAFGDTPTPSLISGVVLTLTISAAYTYLRTTKLLEMHPTCSSLCSASVRGAGELLSRVSLSGLTRTPEVQSADEPTSEPTARPRGYADDDFRVI